MGKKRTLEEKQNMLASLARLCDEFGRQPSYREINDCSYMPSKGAYCWHFGNIENALNIVRPNLIKENLRQKYTDEELIKEFYKVKEILGKCPSFEEMKKHAKYYPCIMRWRFGSWNNFLKTLGEVRIYEFDTTFKNKKRTFIAKDGHICRSKKEVEIDNILYELGIEHENEVYYPYDKTYNKNSRKRCDWKIGNTYLEYAGMLAYYDIIARKKYRKRIDEKANLCLSRGLDFLYIEPNNLKDIKNELKQCFNL